MNFTTDGMRWEGLLRALQGELMAATVVIVLALVAWSYGRKFIASAERGGTIEAATGLTARSYANGAFRVVLVLTSILIAVRAAQVMAVNRTPRADADKSGVYEQMKANTKEPAAPAK
ncbi:MAG: hypothetical protein K2Y05_08590 [Hyphomicrobiaceae bacterium]|nr:hypothetical protein [Hyphomicrobiaceae bacterium]